MCVCVCIFFFVPTNKKNHVRSSYFTCCRVLFLWSHICINLHVRLHFILRAAGGKSVLPVGMWTGGAGYRTANIPDFERETPGHSKKARFGVAATVRAHSCCWFSRRHYGNMNECVGSRHTGWDRQTDGRTDGVHCKHSASHVSPRPVVMAEAGAVSHDRERRRKNKVERGIAGTVTECM